MKFSVGYQLRPQRDWIDEILRSRADLAEVYFAFPGYANGRSDAAQNERFAPWEAQQRTLCELREIAQAGIPTNLLFNAMCYGDSAQSRAFFERVGQTLDYAIRELGTRSVTTTSPLIAKFIHQNFDGLPVRASVNMEMGSVRKMRTVEQYFDGYYLQRELNRCPEAIESIQTWCADNGKTLHLLANSGCVADCGMHVFHDNLVSHEAGASRMDNAYAFTGVCWDRLRDADLRREYLCNATFIRPEDLRLYEQWFSTAKLATRVNRDPVRILTAYRKGSYRGSLPALMEPNHEGAFLPDLLENGLLPQDFGQHVLSCDKNCAQCSYCKTAFDKALLHLS